MREASSTFVEMKRIAWFRRGMAFACLLAIVLGSFGHLNAALAAPVADAPVLAALAVQHGHPDAQNQAASGQCHHNLPCAWQAVLSPAPLAMPLAASVRLTAITDITDGLTLSPATAPPRA